MSCANMLLTYRERWWDLHRILTPNCEVMESSLVRVVSHLFTGSLAGIGKLPALAGWYSVWYVRYFLYCKMWRELHFVKFCGNSPQKGGLVHQKGGRSEGKRGSRQMYNTEGPYQVFLWYRLGKYQENTNRYHTEIPNRKSSKTNLVKQCTWPAIKSRNSCNPYQDQPILTWRWNKYQDFHPTQEGSGL